MKARNLSWLVAVLGSLVLPAAVAAPQPTTAREIMERVNRRDDGDDRIFDLELLLIDKAGQERRRQVRVLAKDHGEDIHQIVFFLGPADVKDTGLLTYDYHGEAREDDQWLYLPALRKTKRIASTDQSGSFLGTDFSYADLTRLELGPYDFELLGESDVHGSKTWQIQAVPRDPAEIERTGYEKSVYFVRQDNDFVVRAVHWVKQGGKLKYLDVKTLEQIEGIWVGTEIHMTTKKGSATLHKTVMKSTRVRFDQQLDEATFTVRQLEKGPL